MNDKITLNYFLQELSKNASYGNWKVASLGVSSEHKFIVLVIDETGKEKRLEINQHTSHNS